MAIDPRRYTLEELFNLFGSNFSIDASGKPVGVGATAGGLNVHEVAHPARYTYVAWPFGGDQAPVTLANASGEVPGTIELRNMATDFRTLVFLIDSTSASTSYKYRMTFSRWPQYDPAQSIEVLAPVTEAPASKRLIIGASYGYDLYAHLHVTNMDASNDLVFRAYMIGRAL